MKIFDKKEGWGTKVNFVDENNVVLGYDMDQSCCEHADWFITDKPQDTIVNRGEEIPDLTGWTFDVDYFQSIENHNELDCGEMAVFRIVNGDQEKFIHLFNCHNGYYSHGFSF